MIPYEDKDSWSGFVERRRLVELEGNGRSDINHYDDPHHHKNPIEQNNRLLKHHHKSKGIEKKRRKKLDKLIADPGIQIDTMHGLMIDAGSTGSRMHVYEFKKRVLEDEKDISDAVSGLKLSYPGTDSRWTDRLSPGLATFSTKSDEELLSAIAEYLKPLIEFAEAVLDSKRDEWSEFPIYLKATAGMRMLKPEERIRLMNAVRKIFNDPQYSKFKFEHEYARVISGEEEAIYGWAGANFVLGSLLKSSEGSGTVSNPKLTHGALEMGGASTQISFYQDQMDIMSNLFKLQIGQGKHWNVYAHSHLCFGINEAWKRMGAWLSTEKISNTTAVGGLLYNPCLPGETTLEFESTIVFEGDIEVWNVDTNGNPLSYQTKMVNQNRTGDYDACTEIALYILNKQSNAWCSFSHHGDCSFSGVYQPSLPKQSKNFGEFLAFSNYFHVWDFLQIPLRSSLTTLQEGARNICSMNEQQIQKWNNGRYPDEDAIQMCFRASYVFQILRNGYGFNMDDNITATNVVAGQKVGWALGSMLYEINTIPWRYIPRNEIRDYNFDKSEMKYFNYFLVTLLIGMLAGLSLIFRATHRRGRQVSHTRSQYLSIENIELEPSKN